ncbi:hypothetical protein GN958_ATG20217 [Phytophthora infestans]|uniref:Uncharacterized protein n=1 Tax=Phytophthora infestans TaxID=4787 RepID=A0A8S9TP01_PHYIN|nr:hypothetical protein GN958_ATG20217 [Phytophthora infestans]
MYNRDIQPESAQTGEPLYAGLHIGGEEEQKRAVIERKEEEIRKRSRQRDVQLGGEDETGEPSQSALNKLVTDFVYELGSAFRIVELPSFRCLVTRGFENVGEIDDDFIEDGLLAWQTV